MKPVSEGQKVMYLRKKEATLQNIQEAIDTIQADDRVVTKKELIEMTGLSSGTFSQPYVKELLEKNRVCQYREKKQIILENKKKLESEKISDLEKQCSFLKEQVERLKQVVCKKDKSIGDLKSQIESLRNENQSWLGKYQYLLEYLDAAGLNVHELLGTRNRPI